MDELRSSAGCLPRFGHVPVLVILATVSLSGVTSQELLNFPDSMPDFSQQLATSMSNNNEDKELSSCEICRLVVQSFEKGIVNTARGKHEGGDTSWEERNLKSYADSEVRLVEIQEGLCEDVTKGKAECLSLSEDAEAEIETWWFKQRSKNVRLHDYLCISKLKRCCPEATFGPTCQPCTSDCSKHGSCDGAGTRSGSGKCRCDPGYGGDNCADCTDDHFRVATGDHFTCLACDRACKGCYGPGKTNCTQCREGYTDNEHGGCIDINECDNETQVCTDNTYCINTDGSYKCSRCHVSCAGCVGFGPNMCIACAPGYKADEEYHCRSLEELKESEEETLRQGTHALARYLFYIGMMAFSIMIFRSNSFVMYTFTLGFVVILILGELDYMSGVEDYTRTSSE